MAFPNLITSAGGPSLGFPGAILAPNGALYVATQGSGVISSFTLSMLKSTDGGNTWALMDDTGSPTCNLGGSLVASIGTAPNTKIWMASVQSAGHVEQVCAFDTASDTWVSATTLTLQATGSLNGLAAVLRADGTFIVAGTVPGLDIGGRHRTGYFLFNTSTLTYSAWIPCGSTVAAAEDWSVTAFMRGVGEYDMLLTVTGGTTGRVARQSLSDSNALGSVVTIDTFAGTDPFSAQGFSDGTNAIVIWSSGAVALGANVYIAPVSTWNFAPPQTIQMPGSETQLGSATGVTGQGSYYAFLMDSNSGDVYVFQNTTGSGFDGGTLLGSQPVNPQPESVWAGLIGAMWNIVFGLGPAYFWSGTVAPAPTPPNAPSPPIMTIHSFPQNNPCCMCPPLVTCAQCGGDGKMYVASKIGVQP